MRQAQKFCAGRLFHLERSTRTINAGTSSTRTLKLHIKPGSCATVYHGLWCGSDVAVKIFSDFEYSEDLLRTFRQEVLLMKRLRHPNILLFMGAVTSRQHLCIVAEFLPRGSLYQLFRRNPPALDWTRRVLMALDIARGMNYLHCYNPPIVHRDLKSSNLLVDNKWNLKVGDFGMARLKHATFLTTKNGQGTMTPSFHPITKSRNRTLKRPMSQSWWRSGSCPMGTIPMRRIQKQELRKATSLEHYGRKYPYISRSNKSTTSQKTNRAHTLDLKSNNIYVSQSLECNPSN